jgi:adenylate kinase
MEVDAGEINERILGRWRCVKCGGLYHEKNIRSQHAGTGDKCGGKLIRRVDDTEAILRERLEWYESLPETVVKRYEPTGLLRRVNANGLHDCGCADVLELLPV